MCTYLHYILSFLKPPEIKNLDEVITGTTFEAPYDATRAGPMCEQGNRSPDGVDDLNEININDVVDDIIEVTHGVRKPLYL